MSNTTKNILRERSELAVGNNVICLNIGLVASDDFVKSERDRVLPPEPSTVDLYRLPEVVGSILMDLKELGFDVLRYRVAQSGTEPTLVVTVVHEDANVIADSICAVANRYAQDCIAVRNVGGCGVLLGDFSEKWGEFNPEYFISM